jgi:mannose-1-phosphate guanylyltransferase
MAAGRRGRFHAVILAGGSGTRFWPLSRAARPKQFLSFAGGRALLSSSWSRVRKLAGPSRIWVVAPSKLEARVRELLPGLRPDRLVVEPTPRNTAPAVALACATVAAHDPDAVVGVFPADHVVRDLEGFVAAVRVAIGAARRGALVCLGVKPDRAATGFGYLRCAERPRRGRAVAVARFVEKPDLARARRFVRSGRHLWNAGMFVWGAETFLDEARRVRPALVRAVGGHLAGRPRSWSRAPKISVDYAVMERARGVEVVPLDVGWDDVGSWEAASRLTPAARADGRNRRLLESPGSAVFGDGRFVAIVGVSGVTVVDTPDALLVVSNERAEEVKQIVEQLRKRGRKELL